MNTFYRIFRTRYRIMPDIWRGFEAQFRYWWMPFWTQCSGGNSVGSLAESEALVGRHRAGLPKYSPPVPIKFL